VAVMHRIERAAHHPDTAGPGGTDTGHKLAGYRRKRRRGRTEAGASPPRRAVS
jgi:hypothetical protein